MPDILTLDTQLLLDNSEVGKAAAQELQRRWAAAAQKDEGQRALLRQELEDKRFLLRKALLERSRPIVERLAKKRKARWVLEAGAVLWGECESVTREVIAEVDAEGPLYVG